MIVDKIKKRENKGIYNKKTNIDIPVGKWIKCDKCKEIVYKETVRNNYSICPNCGHYFRMHIGRRVKQIIDEGTYKRFELNIDTTNPLELEDYPNKLKVLREKTKLEEAVACGTGKIYGEKVANAVVLNEVDYGIVCCGTGIGISLAANKVPGIRCAVVSDVFSAKMSKAHNNANMLSLGERVLGKGLALEIVDAWINTEFEGDRHLRRVNMLNEIEKKYNK